ncbi:MarR family transcriptional regulator [Pseudonocardia sp.]|uniref:winged helix-turn-helix domain-containing protein n=1 Tax=Pseudonocardia sp. TaxID=60912 RepID=UPI003D0A4DA5
MVVAAPPLLPLFRSRLQGDLLAALLLVPDAEHTLTELARRTGASLAAVQREVDRLEEAGLLRSRRVGPARLVSADRGSPAVAPLTDLVALSFGPVQILAEEFDGVAGLDVLDVFGSWAARHHGERGRPPADVDVLAVGEPDRDAVHEAARRAEERIGLPVNVTVVSAARWAAGEDGFVRRVRSAPRVPVPR